MKVHFPEDEDRVGFYPKDGEEEIGMERIFSFGKENIERELDTVIIPDIHGDVFALLDCLLRFGLINAKGEWLNRKVRLVFLGDLIDRGGHDRKVLDFVIRLKKYVEGSEGEFVCLAGNHELFLLSVLYGEKSVPQVSTHIFNFWSSCRGVLRDFGFNPDVYHSVGDIREVFFREENKKYIDFLTSLRVFYQFDDVLTVHGSVTPFWAEKLSKEGVESVNNQFWASVYSGNFAGFLDIPHSRSSRGVDFDVASPLWTDFSSLNAISSRERYRLVEGLDEIGAKYVLCGHQYYHVVRKIEMNDKTFLCLDTAMTRGYGGVTKAGGMQISAGSCMHFVAVNSDGTWHTSLDDVTVETRIRIVR